MNPGQGQVANSCIAISALAIGASAVVIGIAARNWRSALLTALHSTPKQGDSLSNH